MKTVANDADEGEHLGTAAAAAADGCWVHSFDVQKCWEVVAVVLRPTMRFHVDPDSDDTEVKLHEFSSTKTLLLVNNPGWRLVMHFGCVLKNGYSYTSATAHTYNIYGENDCTAHTLGTKPT